MYGYISRCYALERVNPYAQTSVDPPHDVLLMCEFVGQLAQISQVFQSTLVAITAHIPTRGADVVDEVGTQEAKLPV